MKKAKRFPIVCSGGCQGVLLLAAAVLLLLLQLAYSLSTSGQGIRSLLRDIAGDDQIVANLTDAESHRSQMSEEETFVQISSQCDGKFKIGKNSYDDRFSYLSMIRCLFNNPPQIIVQDAVVAVNEGDIAANLGYVYDLDGDPIRISSSLGELNFNGEDMWSWICPAVDGPRESQVVTLTADDTGGGRVRESFLLSVRNVPPTLGVVSVQREAVRPGEEVFASASFNDPGVLDEHAAVWEWGDGATTKGVVHETNGSGFVTGSHVYDTPGSYTVRVMVIDTDQMTIIPRPSRSSRRAEAVNGRP